MKALAAIVVIAALAAGIYFIFIKDSEPYSTYKKFATAIARGNREEALQYAEGPDVLGGDQENRGQTAGGMSVDALTGITYARESESKSSDGSVTIVALQSVHFDPPGATSAMGAMTARYRQTATLEQSNGKWVVVSMDNEFVEMRNWKGEKQ